MTNSQPQLPPELQERINNIIAEAQAPKPQPQQQQQAPVTAPPARPPSLMDHVIALRQEVHALRQQTEAIAQVTQAVGNAVGELYQMFCQQSQPTNYSTAFQEGRPSQVDDADY